MQNHFVEGAPDAIGPYCHAVRTGNLVFCSGQAALDPATMELVGESVGEQTEQTLKNIIKSLMKAVVYYITFYYTLGGR